jgi:hypothetical protein
MCHHHFTREREPLREPIEAADEEPDEDLAAEPEPELEAEDARIFVPPADD